MNPIENSSNAIANVQNFYLQHGSEVGQKYFYKLSDAAAEYVAEIVQDISAFHDRRTALRLILEKGDSPDYERLRKFAYQIHTPNTPVGKILIRSLKTSAGGMVSNCEEQFIPQEYAPAVSTRIISKPSTTSAPFKATPQATLPVKAAPQATTRKIEGQTFVKRYVIKEENISLEATGCTFDAICVVADVHLNTVRVNDWLRSQQGVIKAINSELQEVDVRNKGKGEVFLLNSSAKQVWASKRVEWRNPAKADTQADAIECDGTIILYGINAELVTSKEAEVEIGKGAITTLQAVGRVTLSDAKIGLLKLILPREPSCELILKNTSIDEVIFVDDPNTIFKAKNSSLFVAAFPPSFNFPRKEKLGYLSSDASGRIGGNPYQLIKGAYKEGVKITIKGTGSISKISYENTQPCMLNVDKEIVLPQ